MTREEAKIEMEEEFKTFLEGCGFDSEEKIKQEMSKNDEFKRVVEANRMALQALEQEPCEDAVSRQAVLKCFTWTNDKADVWNRIKELPPVDSQPKTGHWIKSRDCYGNNHFTCSECGNDIATQYADNWEDKYCSECGCRMVEPQERGE